MAVHARTVHNNSSRCVFIKIVGTTHQTLLVKDQVSTETSNALAIEQSSLSPTYKALAQGGVNCWNVQRRPSQTLRISLVGKRKPITEAVCCSKACSLSYPVGGALGGLFLSLVADVRSRLFTQCCVRS